MAEKLGIGHILPLEVMDKCIGRKMWVIMKENKEFYGTLIGFDEFMNMQMEDCKEFSVTENNKRKVVSTLDSMLLNGTHVCMMVPGDNPTLNNENYE
jgi:U6 snRNA-associated Sm-like protein LSm5